MSTALAALTLALAMMASQATAASNTTNANKPNIVWIMADDLGYGEPGSYPCTSPHGRIQTPNLDQFAAEGMRFTDAYAGYTVCAPSRTTLFTGVHSGQFPKYGLSGTSLGPDKTNPTMLLVPQLLKKAGYNTAAVGKLAPLTKPVQQGFDYFIGQIDQAACHNMYPRVMDTMNATSNVNLTKNWKPKSRELCMANPDEYSYTVDLFNDAGLAWLKTQGKETPFFLYLSFTVPHAGGWSNMPADKESGAPVPSDGPYTNQSWPDVERDHAAVITYLDNQIGQVLAQLKAMGVDDNTVVFFASDNGAHLEGGHDYKFFNSTGGLLGHKRSLFEGGVRSPSMVRWPGTVKAGTVSNHQWAFWDVLPTVADIVGETAAVPAYTDGVSFLPTLTGQGTQKEPDFLFWTWRGTGVPPMQEDAQVEVQKDKQTSGYAVRSGMWKGVVPHCSQPKGKDKPRPSKSDPLQLYDLLADPFETTDVASKNPEQVAKLLARVVAANITCTCFQC